ncbi:hypothetical protein EYF80_007470 [Liparis tanakae]|uniref:Uncharacterized protein n=1 Tax=Liparis tanakae TaxID=230148 RepID=A0A4Z2IWI6_9TELE|nr:hypothetical protein EYF80_007470 [Liparis tanakae]
MELTVTSEGLKRNCLLRLDFSMVSMSVTMTSPSPAASPIMAKFFNSSQPMAPAPTWNDKPLKYTTDLHHFLCSQTSNEGIDGGQVTRCNIRQLLDKSVIQLLYFS